VRPAGPGRRDHLQRPDAGGNFGAGELNAFTEEHFWRALRHAQFTLEWQGDGPRCEVEGTLWGGNLAMLVSLMGTPWMPEIDGGVLVLEDVNEQPFRVERMLLQLLNAGVLQRQSAVVLGSFSGGAANDYDAGYDLAAVRAFLRDRLAVPLIDGLDFGHEPRTVTLPLGARAVLKKDENGVRLTLSGHPVL
jgi:muramoyltetrapeptide carboxypeptidase